MSRNKEFSTCPECYGQGYTGYSNEDGDHSQETCYSCDGVGARPAEDLIEDSFARAEQDMGK